MILLDFLCSRAGTRTGDRARNAGTLNIGDRVDVMALGVADGKATLDYVAPGPGESACCPTLMVSGIYGLKGGKLAELSRKERGNLSVDRLAGTSWHVAGFDREEPVPEGIEITAEFEGDRISGFAGCNRYFATVKAPTPYELSIRPAGATRKACPPTQMQAETRFLQALEGATRLGFMLGKLVLDYRIGDTYSALVFERTAQE